MAIQDKEIVELVAEQMQYFIDDAPLEKKIDVYKRIIKRQKKLLKSKDD